MRASPAITGGNPIMATDSHSFTPETAREFDRYSIANAVTVKQSLPCGCEPYVDVFTYRRWRAQGFQVQRREVFQVAVSLGACALIVAHNHPSGDPSPSAEDRDVTQRLARAGALL